MSPDYIFVYGTLRRAVNNEMSQLLFKHATFIDEASFQGKLYQIDYYPGAVASDNADDIVKGEVYLLNQAEVLLPLLDKYEEFGPTFPEPNEYLRQQQQILLNNGRLITAWMYVYNHATEGLKLIQSVNINAAHQLMFNV